MYHNSSYCYFRNLGSLRQVNLESIISNLIKETKYHLECQLTYKISVYKLYNIEKKECLLFSWLSPPYYQEYLEQQLQKKIAILDIFQNLEIKKNGYTIFGSKDLKKLIAQYL